MNKKKKIYVKPSIEVVAVEMQSLLAGSAGDRPDYNPRDGGFDQSNGNDRPDYNPDSSGWDQSSSGDRPDYISGDISDWL